MTGHIVRKGLLETSRERTTIGAVALMAVLFAAAATVGWTQARDRERQRTAAEAQERRLWLDQGTKTPHAAAHYGFYVYRPTPPLVFFDPGVETFVPAVAHLEAHGQQLAKWAAAEDLPVASRLGILSPATVLQVAGPLLLLALLAGIVAREREEGLLRLVTAQGVSIRALLAGKLLAAAVPVAAAVVPGAIATGVTAIWLAPTGAGSAPWVRLTAEAIVYGLFCWTFGAVVVLLSLGSSTVRRVLVAATAIWIAAVFLGPRAVVDLAARRYPVPTPEELAGRAGEDAAARPSYWDERVPEVTRRLLAEHGVTRAEDLPVDPTVVALLEEEAWDTERATARIESVLEAHRARDRFAARAAALIPMLGVQHLSRALAGTDADAARHFTAYAERYRRQAMRIINEAALHERYVDVLQTGQPPRADQDLWRRVPPFEYQPPTLSSIVRRQWMPLAAQVVWAFVLTGIVVWRAGRVAVE